MTVYPLCDPYAWEQPNVLMKTGLTPKFHKEGVCISELVNQLVLIYLVAFMFACVVTVLFQNKFVILMIIGFVTLYSVPNIAVVLQLLRAREGFQDATVPLPKGANSLLNGGEDARQYDGSRDVVSSKKEKVCKFGYCWEDDPVPVYDVIGGGGAINMPHTLPTTKNPFMNVLIDEIKYKENVVGTSSSETETEGVMSEKDTLKYFIDFFKSISDVCDCEECIENKNKREEKYNKLEEMLEEKEHKIEVIEE